jgi:hypothetical protein
MGARRAYRRYGKKARIGARKVAGARAKVRTVERRLATDVKAVEHRAAEGARRLERAAAKDIKTAEKKTAKELRHLAKDLTLFCDNCGKAMKPGGHVSRMFGGRELRFCSALCSAKYRPEHLEF